MLKFIFFTQIVLLCVTFLAPPVRAIDYTVLDNNLLYELKGAIKNASTIEQEAYQKEWQLRLNKMTEEELKRYTLENNTNSMDKKPIVQGTGYDSQGTGTIIYGGTPSGN